MNGNYAPLFRRRWLYLVLFSLINFCTGALYVWSVFASALAVHLSRAMGVTVTVAQLGAVFGTATAVTPILMFTGGYVNDRFGPRFIIMVGGVLLAIGYWLSARAVDVTTLYMTYGLCVGAGTGLVNGCTINSAVKFFPDRRGFAGGLVTASLGVGGALLPFLANALIASQGISTTLMCFALLLGVVVVSAALPLVKCPDGFSAFVSLSAPQWKAQLKPSARQPAAEVNLNWRDMLRTARFYPLFLVFAMCATLGLMLISNISAIAATQMRFSAALIALSVSTLSLANTAGRFLSGVLSDRLGRMPTLQLVLLVALVALWLLYGAQSGDTVQFLAGLVGVGLCYGASFGVYPGLVADEFGALNNSVNFSVMAFAYSIGGFLGPWIIRWVNASGYYALAYAMGLAVAVLGLLGSLAYYAARARDVNALRTEPSGAAH